MNLIFKILIVFVSSVLVGLLISPFVISICRKHKLGQTVLHYVESHSSKSGTPTMGGVIFIFASIAVCSMFLWQDSFFAWTSLLVMFAFGLLGFLDDFIKIHFRQNEGLKPYQKLIGQFTIAIMIAFLIHYRVGTSLDFFGLSINLGWGIIPFAIFVFLATVNSVNLTDGLDGLAGGVSLIYLLFFGAILAISGFDNLALSSFAVCGGILAFLAFNTYPAKIFMGDTGSLALGGFISCMALFSGKALYLPLMGIMFVLSALSDIIQVIYYKKTKKRVFLMAPLHHHFEKKGVHENRIVTIYIIVTSLVCASCLFMELYF